MERSTNLHEEYAAAHANTTDDGYGVGYMQPMNCPSCGLVPTCTGTCGYCGSTCE